jgi:sugar lactone lactonase YvrE
MRNPATSTTIFAGLLAAFLCAGAARAQYVSTVVTNLNSPTGVAVDSNNNLYIADTYNNRIAKFVPGTGTLMTLAGSGEMGTTDGDGVAASFDLPWGIVAATVAGTNGLIVSDYGSGSIRFVTYGGSVSTLADTNFATGESDGPALSANFSFPSGMAVDSAGNIYVADAQSGAIRKIAASNDMVYTITTNFAQPYAVAVDNHDNIWVADSGSNHICMMTSNGTVTLVVGSKFGQPGTNDSLTATNARFNAPAGLLWLPNNSGLYVSDTGNNTIRSVIANGSNGYMVQTVAGLAGLPGSANGAVTVAQFNAPMGLCVDPTDAGFYVADSGNKAVRVLVTTVPLSAATEPATGISSTNASLNGTVTAGDTSTSYYFEWGFTTNYGNSTTTNILTNHLTGAQTISATLPYLSPATTYHFQLVAYNSQTNSLGGDIALLTLAEPPVVATLPPTNITFSSVLLQASVNPEYSPTEVTFLWGTTSNLGNTTAPISLTTNLTSYQTVTCELTNLQPGTTYFYQVAANSTGGTADGAQLLFSTPSSGVNTLPATNVTATSATLQATVNPEGTPTTVYFQWGTTTNYGSNTPPTNLTGNLTNTQPISSTISNLQPDTIYYYQAVISNIDGTIGGTAASFTTLPPPPPTLSFSPSNGYFPECVSIYVTSSVQTVYYTMDGSTPTTNSAEILLTNSLGVGTNVGSFLWCEPLLNLSALQLLAANGTNIYSMTLLQGGFPTTNSIGFPQPLSAGPGAHLYIPVVVEMQSNTALESVQFRVEITPNPPNTNVITSISLQPITANDFVPFPGPAPGDAPVNFTNYPYTIDTTEGAVITATGGSGLDMTASGVAVLLHFTIPSTATYGQSYSLNVLDPSGTSDGQQANVGLVTLPAQTLSISYNPDMVGDSSPSAGYNAGQFGIKGFSGSVIEVGLDNADVNNAIYASTGIRVPPSDSDAFNDMDAYPPDSAGHGGDGVIGFNDWQTILGRSLGVSLFLGMDTNNYLRFWTNGDTTYRSHSVFTNWLAGGSPVPLSLDMDSDSPVGGPTKLSLTNAPPGLVWFCEAAVGSGTITDAIPGNTYSLPVYVNVLPGYSLAGMQFRAIVTASSGAPAVSSIQFNPASGVPNPLVLPGLSGNDKIQAWSFGSFATALQNSNYLGTISFEVPPGAFPGVCYALHFSGVDGAPNFTIDYQMESHPGYVWVMTAARQPASITSDEWKIAFFGSPTNSQAGDDVDADGDGALNWQEYLAGTNPTNALSRLQFTSASLYTNGLHQVAIDWLTAPGKTYILQSSPAANGANWTPVNTNSGDGNPYQCIVTNMGVNARFFQILLP